eukprot:899379-Rhodomonas_salina.2
MRGWSGQGRKEWEREEREARGDNGHLEDEVPLPSPPRPRRPDPGLSPRQHGLSCAVRVLVKRDLSSPSPPCAREA